MSPLSPEQISIVPFEEKHSEAFKDLNVWWIEQYFKMEEMDYLALDNPQDYILDKGGYIAIALLDKKPVGVCALIKLENSKFDFELAKMGVSKEAHGIGIGYSLGLHVLEKAKQLGAKSVFLETNTILTPAIKLYNKLGFKKINGMATPYQRSNYQMEFIFEQ